MSLKLQFTPEIYNQLKAAAETCCSITTKKIPFRMIAVKDLGIVFQHDDLARGRSLFKAEIKVDAFELFKWELMSDKLFIELLYAQVFGPVDKTCMVEWTFTPRLHTIDVQFVQSKESVSLRKKSYKIEKQTFRYYDNPKHIFMSGNDIKVATADLLAELKIFSSELKSTDITLSYNDGYLNILALTSSGTAETNLDILSEESNNPELKIKIDIELLIKILTKLKPKSKVTHLLLSDNVEKEVGFIIEGKVENCSFKYYTSRKYDNDKE